MGSGFFKEEARSAANKADKLSDQVVANGDVRQINGAVAEDKSFDIDDGGGLYKCIGVDHLLRLVDCLLDSHILAQKFNGNNAQRTLLWKAGFKVHHTYFCCSSNDALFTTLLVRCVVQLELVDAVCSILFGPESLKKCFGFVLEYSSFSGVDHLLRLVDCLLDSHILAQKFNGNNAQRTLLWKAGFKGRSKPNLLRQETHSVRTALNILYRLYSDVGRTTAKQKVTVKKKLLKVLVDALSYYSELNSEQHRQAWISVIHLLLERTNAFSSAQLVDLGQDYALDLCRLVECDMREDLRIALSRVIKKAICISYTT
ncbi:unnamed protein product [Gongylonema pulchrum]|uniref:DUF2428 domain-containing protein n=1 Tax=Gongylonema pulchrum TaxID=637853 RepID=A0A183DWS6_9BILA|nr:unnamed protein product [Gongylonema pulchrum]